MVNHFPRYCSKRAKIYEYLAFTEGKKRKLFHGKSKRSHQILKCKKALKLWVPQRVTDRLEKSLKTFEDAEKDLRAHLRMRYFLLKKISICDDFLVGRARLKKREKKPLYSC